VPWQRIWEHEQNTELRERRDRENILCPGDVVFIPEKETRQETAATEQRHRFRVRGRSVRFRLRLVRPVGQSSGSGASGQGGGGTQLEPRAGVAFQLDVEGRIQSGTADNDGVVDVPVPANATQGRLIIDPGPEQEIVDIRFGRLNPLNEISGIKQRLTNLGFFHSNDENEDLDEDIRKAIRAFQVDQGLKVINEDSNEIDEATLNRIRELHGR